MREQINKFGPQLLTNEEEKKRKKAISCNINYSIFYTTFNSVASDVGQPFEDKLDPMV